MAEFVIINNIPPEYAALSDALSEFFYACGSKTLCRACFQGKLHKSVHGDYGTGEYTSKGCCGACPNSQPTGCVQKPVGCATYTCESLDKLVPLRLKRRVRRFWVRDAFSTKERSYPGAGCYPYTLEDVAQAQYPRSVLKRIKALTDSIRRMTRWVRLTGWKPDWKEIEEFTKADVGVLR